MKRLLLIAAALAATACTQGDRDDIRAGAEVTISFCRALFEAEPGRDDQLAGICRKVLDLAAKVEMQSR